MHGLMPHRHVPLQLDIDRAYGALQPCSSAIDQYQVSLCSDVGNVRHTCKGLDDNLASFIS